MIYKKDTKIIIADVLIRICRFFFKKKIYNFLKLFEVEYLMAYRKLDDLICER